MIGVVTDSAASLSDELVAELGIEVVPLYLTLGDETLRDGADLDDFYERLERDSLTARTHTPSPGDFLAAFERAAGEDLVCVTVASSVSGVHQAANLAADRASKRVVVVDSGSASMGQGFVVLAAARVAAKGGDLDEVAAAAKEVASRTRLVATLDTFEHLRRSGRVGRMQAFAATSLRIKPVFEMADGRIGPVARPRTRRRALERVAAEAIGDLEGRRAHLAAFHAHAEDEARDLLRRVAARCEVVEEHVVEFTPAMGAHTGPGVVGLAYYTEWREATG